MITIQLTWIGVFAVLGCTFVGSLVGVMGIIASQWYLADIPKYWFLIIVACALIGAILGWVFVL